ncbi:MAG: DUF6992 family protein, partial [Bacteroidota bacterium]
RFTILILLLPLGLFAQDKAQSIELNEQLTGINSRRLTTNKRGMWTLGSWAVANIGLGLVMRAQTQGVDRAFWTMNAGWNTVNLALAGFGLYGAYTGSAELGLAKTNAELQSIQQLLLFNAGLDVGYMATGMWLRERGKRNLKHAERWTGWGNALLIQGGFLLAFDLVMAWRHHRTAKALDPLFDQLELSVGAGGMGLAYVF